MNKKVNAIAECCCNHMGNFDIAIEMIKTAKLCNADYVKFQKRNCIKAVPKNIQDKPHPCPINAFGETYLQHRQALEFDIHQHKALKNYAESIGIKYSCSVWDEDSAAEIISLNPDYIKIPSALNCNFKLLDYVFSNYNKQVHISLGMTTKQEIQELYKYLEQYKDRTVVYWTTSDYPVKFDELYLLEINNIPNHFEKGFSGHHSGISVDIAAVTLGAIWIERHFTLDRTWKGTDQAASLETSGLTKLCRDIKATCNSLQYKNIDLTNGEKNNREKLKICDKRKILQDKNFVN